MAVELTCNCGRRLRATDALVGKFARCPHCGRKVVVPNPEVIVSPAPETTPEQPAKICVICGQDCSDKPRLKDQEGRYYHATCHERALQRRRTIPPAESRASRSRQPQAQAAHDASAAELPWFELLDEEEPAAPPLPPPRRLVSRSARPRQSDTAWKTPVLVGAGGLAAIALIWIASVLFNTSHQQRSESTTAPPARQTGFAGSGSSGRGFPVGAFVPGALLGLAIGLAIGAVFLRLACAICRVAAPNFLKAMGIVFIVTCGKLLVFWVMGHAFGAFTSTAASAGLSHGASLRSASAFLTFLFVFGVVSLLLPAAFYQALLPTSFGKGILIELTQGLIVTGIIVVVLVLVGMSAASAAANVL